MGTALRFHPFPRMWKAAEGPGSALQIGNRRVALRDVTGFTSEGVVEHDGGGLVVMGLVFALAGALILIGVADLGWRTRFLAGAAIFLVLGLVSLREAVSLKPIRYVRVRIETAAGEVLFTTASEPDARALSLALASQASRAA